MPDQVTQVYTCDAAGNRVQEIRPNEDIYYYSYNANDQLTRIDMPDFIYQEYDYDARGNLIGTTDWVDGAIPVQTGAINYTYDARNQLIDFNGQASFAYDHDGRRISATAGGATTNYLWDEFSSYGDVVLETGTNGTRSYTLAAGILISQTDTAGTLYFLPDAQGSTRALVDGTTGALGQTYDYDAFGNLQGDYLSGLDTNYLYTGQQFDPVSELYSLRARYYDPSIGRFLSRDTWAYDYQNPVELNRYVYARNNPATYYDPSGHFGLAGYAINIASKATHIAAYGAAQGAFFGFVGGMVTVLAAATGACGNWMQQEMARAGVGSYMEYIRYMTKMGALIGAVAGLGITAAGTLFGPLGAAAVGNSVAAYGLLDAGLQFSEAPNLCTALLFVMELVDNDIPVEDGVDMFRHMPRNKDYDSSRNHFMDDPVAPNPYDSDIRRIEDDVYSRGGCSIGNSFSADTDVSTPHGDIAISDIDVGDTVLAYNELIGKVGEYEVTHTISHTDEVIVHLYIDGELIETTPEHPFYNDEGEWIDAENLEVGEEILSLDGDYGIVEKVVVIEDANQPMYNLTVDEAHTFFVGDGDWLVHNCDWETGQPNKPSGDGVYRFPDQTDEGLPYIGQGNLRSRLDNHYSRNRIEDWDQVKYMKISDEFSSDDFDQEFVLKTIERVLMYNASGGNINLLANRKWGLNSPEDLARLRQFYDNLPANWPSEFMPSDLGFFRHLTRWGN